jgi:hypothetical protein
VPFWRGCYLAARARRIVATANTTSTPPALAGAAPPMPVELGMIEVAVTGKLRVEIAQ